MFDYIAYTDGSCNNMSPFKEGGAAYVVVDGNDEGIIHRVESKSLLNTTNNRAEMLAIMSAMGSVPENSSLLVRTDSRYCIRVILSPFHALYYGEERECIADYLIWLRLRLKCVKFEWVKGHSGNTCNEMCDRLARERRKEVQNAFKIPTYSAKNMREPNPRITKFHQWMKTKESKPYWDTIPFS